VSDSNKIPKPPPLPDDFSKTTPNISIPDGDKAAMNDWGKTNYKYPAQPPSDDWGNTVANVRPFDRDDNDFGNTYQPSSNRAKSSDDWGVTQANINIPQDDFGATQSGYGGRGSNSNEGDFGATTPYFRLPEAERIKYQNIPLTPTQEAEKQRREEKEKGGIPTWALVTGALSVMFFFALVVLTGVYFIFIKKSGFEVTVLGAPAGSSILIDGAYWGIASANGSISLTTLKAGETKKIEIKHPNYSCEPQQIKGENGVKPDPIYAKCVQVANISNECINIKAGAYETAEKCANKALDDLPDPFSVDDLLRAMNLYIIQFGSGKYDIPPRNMVFLERAAGYMKKLPPNVVVEVGGHTDNVGNDASNQTLSDNRAKAVREALIKSGVSPEMLTERGYGKTKPKATNETEDGKFQNRRIEYSAVKR
jgi:outer membrane protein OmpA-like peptidoglycan-associated protein